ncbi:MAG: Na(+)-translocating NADH-quinone reductase subunit A, partial [Bacteroidales bacterium]|nr:Na(+)-translocating NADH-quinone reductase subunit A [Bacteroidales bacterium]
LKPTDFVGLTPRLLVAEGDSVQAGTPLFCDKADEQILFASPVSGTVTAITRGERRAITEVVVTPDGSNAYVDFGPAAPLSITREQIVGKLLQSGTWPYLRQRPFGTVANPAQPPKAIVVSGFDTAPLAPDYDLLLHGRGEDFQAGLDAISRLTDGPVHLNLNPKMNLSGVFRNSKNVKINLFEGKHPAGNVGTQINRLCPINKGETVWFVGPQDVATIGNLFNTGHYNPQKLIAFAGQGVDSPCYFHVLSGASIEPLAGEKVKSDNMRFISGNVLTGSNIGRGGHLGFYDNMVTVIPEGDDYEFMGWLAPGLKKFSFSHTFLSGILNTLGSSKKYNVNTNTHGGQRALVQTGKFEQVFPFDIYPLQLLKACIIGDIEQMEALGIYEVEPEDFALCEFIDVSKTDMQQIIRNALETLRKEC